MTSDLAGLVRALTSMENEPPSDLLQTLNFFRRQAKTQAVSEAEVVDHLVHAGVNDPARVRFTLLLARWDSADPAEWAVQGDGKDTIPNSAERRDRITTELGLSPEVAERVDHEFPRSTGPIIIKGTGGDWKPWYRAQRQAEHDFYWQAYSGLLLEHGWPSTAVSALDVASTAVVRRLADPLWSHPYQSKGLVVGYVQSGKTANFTGVIAKAIDAGYRLIIVLTGTIELLRSQTQRRLDMELLGEANILGAIKKTDTEKIATTDYHDDKDWQDGKFLSHGIPIHETDGIPLIRRLSTRNGDYRRLKLGLSTLDFRAGHELKDKKKPLYAAENLFNSDVRLAVVKKNSTVLGRLVADLGEIHADLAEIPAVIIDDEADQASVNTKRPNPKNPTSEEKERTAINRRISEILGLLTRCQYIGYTATPFANVFIDPDDSEDIFPKDFIVTLPRPTGYMGASDFHDLNVDFGDESKSIDNSNEKDYVRDLWSSTQDERTDELAEALDAFLLSGAVKLYRRSAAGGKGFRHHTMLVHESVKTKEHDDLAGELREIWKRAGYSTPGGVARLRRLWDNDFGPVCRAVAGRIRKAAIARGEPEPDLSANPIPTFDQLRRFIGAALDLVQTGTSPVIVVNGVAEKDYHQDSLDFQGTDVWKILVGGAKLSRGFTVEGLTVSYYTRRTQQADTLMQMGRWYGFRHGYGDLIRLYIGRGVPGPRNTKIDLYEAFEAVVQDEEDFREELSRFADPEANEGQPQVRPEDVPPMVFQRLPWLKPTATNKMYNAELTQQGVGGKLSDFPMQPDWRASVNRSHLALSVPLIARLSAQDRFQYEDGPSGKPGMFDARYGILPAAEIIDFVGGFDWTPNYSFTPHLNFMREILETGALVDFVVLLPLLKDADVRRIEPQGIDLPVLRRARRADRPGFSGSSKRQRDAVETIAGRRDIDGNPVTSGGPAAVALRTPTRGCLLLTFALDPEGERVGPTRDPKNWPPGPIDSSSVATLFSYAIPYESSPRGRIGFVTRKSGGPAIVDRTS